MSAEPNQLDFRDWVEDEMETLLTKYQADTGLKFVAEDNVNFLAWCRAEFDELSELGELETEEN